MLPRAAHRIWVKRGREATHMTGRGSGGIPVRGFPPDRMPALRMQRPPCKTVRGEEKSTMKSGLQLGISKFLYRSLISWATYSQCRNARE